MSKIDWEAWADTQPDSEVIAALNSAESDYWEHTAARRLERYAKERAAVVRYMRAQAQETDVPEAALEWRIAADCIERGEHLKDKP